MISSSSSRQNMINLLSSVEDAHGEVTVEMKEPVDSKLFASMLGSSLSYWIQQKKRVVWIKLPIQFSYLFEPSVKEGFWYHHADSDYLVLVKWIPETSDTLTVTANASHRSMEDAHGGVTVEMKEPMDSKLFASMLGSSLSYWIQQKKRVVWIILPIEFSNLVEPAVKEGFRYHHAKSDYLVLVKWIPETSDTLPANASHCVGIGGFVMNDEGKLPAVQDRNGGFKGTKVWDLNLPTEAVDETVDEVSWDLNLPTEAVDETVDEYMEVDMIDIFSKILTETDLKVRLTVPTHALEHINMPKGGIIVCPKGSDGKEWPFRCYTRPIGHPKPAFTTGWRKFVKVKGLQIGDKVTFSKLEDEDEAGGAPQYRIRAARAIPLFRLMGEEILDWVDLP